MPLYKFTIKLRNVPRPVTGIREINSHDIDAVYRTYKIRAEEKYNGQKMESFEVVMISKFSAEGKAYISQKRRPPAE